MQGWDPSCLAIVETGHEPEEGRCILTITNSGTVSVDRYFSRRRETFEGEIDASDLADFVTLLHTCNPREILEDPPALRPDNGVCTLSYKLGGKVVNYQLHSDDSMLRPCFRTVLMACRMLASKVSGGLVDL